MSVKGADADLLDLLRGASPVVVGQALNGGSGLAAEAGESCNGTNGQPRPRGRVSSCSTHKCSLYGPQA